MQNLLKEVTYKTIKKLKTQDIILPGEYSQKFSLYAKECNLNLEKETIVLKNLSHDKEQLDLINKATAKNLISLQHTTSTVKLAIENKNTAALLTVQNDIIKMQDKIASLQEQLFTDSLTKAKNRKWFLDFYLKNDKFVDAGYLVFIDLNNFKMINDTYGHIMGDMVLRYLSSYLQKEIVEHNTSLVRYAGDEFMIVFNDYFQKDKLISFLDKIQIKLAKQKLKSKKGKALQFSYSYGMTGFKNNDDFNSILECADKKMYENKEKMKLKMCREK